MRTSELTLYFLTFSTTAPAMVAAPRRDIYRSTGNSTRYRMVYDTWGAPRRGGCWAAPARVNLPYLFSNLPYLFSKLTLYFFTFLVAVTATVAQHRRDIYRPVEKKKSYRLICDTGMCGGRGGRGRDMRPWVDFGIESAVVCVGIVLVEFQVAKLFGRLSYFLSDTDKSATVG